MVAFNLVLGHRVIGLAPCIVLRQLRSELAGEAGGAIVAQSLGRCWTPVCSSPAAAKAIRKVAAASVAVMVEQSFQART